MREKTLRFLPHVLDMEESVIGRRWDFTAKILYCLTV
jgi:hypothetical protein